MVPAQPRVTHKSVCLQCAVAIRNVPSSLWQSGVSTRSIPINSAGWMPVPGRAAYCAAKGALTQFFEVLRLELERDNIHVLMVYPSFLDTPIEHNALGKDGKPASHARSMVGGMRTPEWMVGLVDQALAKRQRWLLPEPVSRFGSLLWRFAPALYLRQVRKRFAGELG